MKVREPEWCNPQIDNRKLPERSKNLYMLIKGKE